jgi:recombination protein RecR
MRVLPKALQQAIDAFSSLPGVGPRTAERYAYWCLRHDKNLSDKLSHALSNLHENIKICPKTFALIDSDQEVSPLYQKPLRDKTIVIVVAEPFDIAAIERVGVYHGTYHVLGGLISPIDNIGPENLHINELLKRIKQDKVIEVIIATNASVEGETTAMYVNSKLQQANLKISRLARGLPIGVDLEYADQITLQRALEGRTKL